LTLNLSPEFIHNIQIAYGSDGERFLSELPARLEEAAHRWNLVDLRPVDNLSYNYVVFATRLPSPIGGEAGGEGEAVLKLGVPNPELTSEIEALYLYGGQGAERLFESDAEKGFLLEERLQPGTMLARMQDDDRATETAAGLMRALWRPVPAENHFIRLKDWFQEFGRYRLKYGMQGPFPDTLLRTAQAYVDELFVEDETQVVLHGDFHHFNILQSGDEWKAIDPKGVIGPRGYEVGPLLINPWPYLLDRPDARQCTERRMAILAERLGMERERIRLWAVAHAVLSACWDLDEQGRGGEYSIACAKMFMQVSP
jgi:streptomycin 6-kinase